jgi:hypothetical protein
MPIWAASYSRYLHKTVFNEHKGNHRSILFDKYFTQGSVRHIGWTYRFAGMKAVELPNTSFISFCEAEQFPIPNSYRKVVPDLESGFKSASKYDREQPWLDQAAWKKSGEWTMRHFAPFLGGSKVLDEDTVVRQLDQTTSPGFPWNLQYQNKSDFFKSGSREFLQLFWKELGEDKPRPMRPIWNNTQKVELRDVHKLFERKVRTFTASPVEHSVALNRLCLDMNVKFYRTNGRHWSFVGRSKYFRGFHELYHRLNKHPNAFELDETNYDSSLFQEAMYGQRDIRWEMLRQCDKTPENKRRLWRLYDDIVNTVIVLENGELVQKSTGNPSGSSNTIVDNTMILFRLFAYAWILLSKKEHGEMNLRSYTRTNHGTAEEQDDNMVFGGYFDFVSHVEAALNGDDNTFTVSDDCVDWFNPTSIKEIWTAIGVVTKTPDEKPRKLSEVQFLSNSFVNINGCWLPCPDEDRIFSSMMWGSKLDDPRWHLQRACALRMDSWPNVKCRVMLQKYIEMLWNEYADKLVGEVHLPNGVPIPVSTILGMWKSDDYCKRLYTGVEHSENPVIPFKESIFQERRCEIPFSC